MSTTDHLGADVRVVLTTAPNVEVAERVSRALVQERLAACANVVPGITSIFRWGDEVQREDEVLVIIKTTAGALDRLRDRVIGLHPYDVPEVIALDVHGGHGAYLDWVRAEVT